ncbi:MAG TPA: cell wall hydrolase [Bacillota bacterium]|nr:cell wall hydrolase [Bacillota bacterium]
MSKIVPRLIQAAAAAAVIFLLGCSTAPANESTKGSNTRVLSNSVSAALHHTVKEGDTLYGIAQEHGVNVKELMAANCLKTSLIRPGDIIVLPEKKHIRTPAGRISMEELKLLARLIYAEARGECFEGQVAVGAVILNRLESPLFPKTVKDVIFQKSNRVYQFSPVGDGSINLEPDEKAMKAAVLAAAGSDPTGGALFFYNPEISRDNWIRTLPVITKIGNHVFAKSF